MDWVTKGLHVRATSDINVPFYSADSLAIGKGELGRVREVGPDTVRVYLGACGNAKPWTGDSEPEEPYLYIDHKRYDFVGLWERVGSRTLVLKSVADAFDQLCEEAGVLAAQTTIFSITFLGYPWSAADPLIWEGGLRHDMFKLAWTKRKIDLSKRLNLPLVAAYDPPIGTRELVQVYGMPTGVRVTF